MAITLLDCRVYCREVASPDSSGSTAEREFMYWINAALQRLYTDADWDKVEKQGVITLLPQETGTTFGLTQGSATITATAELLEKYYDDEWDLLIENESDMVFTLASWTDTSNAVLSSIWTQASDAAATFTAIPSRYTLPNNARRISRVQVLSTKNCVDEVTNAQFDRMKSDYVSEGGQPRAFTLRNGKIEFWPHQGSGYEKVGITYQSGPTLLAEAAADATVITWQDDYRDLLFKAVQLEASITQGAGAPIAYQLARMEYEDRLRKHRGLDVNKAAQTGPMNVKSPARRHGTGKTSFSDFRPIDDIGLAAP